MNPRPVSPFLPAAVQTHRRPSGLNGSFYSPGTKLCSLQSSPTRNLFLAGVRDQSVEVQLGRRNGVWPGQMLGASADYSPERLDRNNASQWGCMPLWFLRSRELQQQLG
jgi:hypothetical protein